PKFVADPSLAKRLFIYPADYAQWISMNMAVPPFDDIHVRKAVNLLMDKAVIQTTIAGGHVEADPATHLGWDSLEDNLLSNYDPYATPGHGGNVAAAKAELLRSRYDPSGEGRCDDPVCRGIQVFVPTAPDYTDGTDLGEIVRRDLAGIGLDLKIHPLSF